MRRVPSVRISPLADHSSLQTTQKYIEGDTQSQVKIVDLIWGIRLMNPFSWIAVATLGLCAPLLSGCVKSDAKYYRCAGFTQSDIKAGEKVFFNPDKRKYVDNIIVEIPKPSLKLFFATKLKTSHVLILNGTPYAVKVNSIYMYETLFM